MPLVDGVAQLRLHLRLQNPVGYGPDFIFPNFQGLQNRFGRNPVNLGQPVILHPPARRRSKYRQTDQIGQGVGPGRQAVDVGGQHHLDVQQLFALDRLPVALQLLGASRGGHHEIVGVAEHVLLQVDRVHWFRFNAARQDGGNGPHRQIHGFLHQGAARGMQE